MDDVIRTAIEQPTFAVTGVSRYPAKFGHRIFKFLRAAGYRVFAVNPNADCIDDETCYASLADLPSKPDVVVTVTQPWITTGTVKEAVRMGIPYVWMQPGSESTEGVQAARHTGIGLVHGGPCVMVEIDRARS